VKVLKKGFYDPVDAIVVEVVCDTREAIDRMGYILYDPSIIKRAKKRREGDIFYVKLRGGDIR
jgi:hypothetical protein